MADANPQILTSEGLVDAPGRVLFVVAHPDDIDFGSAGTAAVLRRAGAHVAYCLVTSGEAGGDDMSISSEEIAETRQREQTAAAAAVGVDTLHWLGVPDGRVVADLDLRCRISRIIRMEKPDVVLTQSPEPNWDRIYGSHPDHLATAQAAMAAVYPDARNPRAHPELLAEGFEPHAVTEVWMGLSERNLFIDITDVIDQKIAALRAHESQTGHMGDRLPELLTEWAADNAAQAGMPDGRLAEGFRRINTA